ncbi:MAG: GSCFA domain-containing protein [Xanthobacteraceae bacterium]|nr:GSCFA domain-containing protein [Xanthobacteraceae bacterium]
MSITDLSFLRRFAPRAKAPAEPAAPLPTLTGRFDVVGEPNAIWRHSARGRRITVTRNPILTDDTRIFTMGSCFAMEIRNALTRRGFEVFPKYDKLEIDPSRQKVSSLPDVEDIPYYDTFTILQEFEFAFGNRHFELKDFLQHTHRLTNHFATGGRTSWQDPHRKRVMAADEASILDISRKIDECVKDGIRQSDIYILTLGLIETWRNAETGYHFCIPPYDDRRGGLDKVKKFEFYLSTYKENYDNLKRICTLIQQHYPERKVILTVSPVGLGRTHTDKDVVVATVEAKSILRAVTAEICREFSNVSYWPSYELATRDDIFREDGRHVREDSVAMIVDTFIEAHRANAPAP